MRRTPFLLVVLTGIVMVISGSAFASSGHTAASPTVTTLPTIAGTARSGQTLTATSGTWTGAAPITYAYQWQSCSSSGRTSASSNLTATVIAKAAAAPVNTTLPLISGSALVGHTLQASTGTWTGPTTGFAYQWSRCNTNGTSCAGISGATGQSYGVGKVDLGNALRVTVTATNTAGSASAVSKASAVGAGVVVRAGFTAELGASPPRRSQAGGALAHFTAKLIGKTLQWKLTFVNVNGRPTVTGLNTGFRATNGAAIKTLCRSCFSPSHGTLTLTAGQLGSMLRGQIYVNLHTRRNLLGELRGQIVRVS